MTEDLISLAGELAARGGEVAKRRAASTAYYAVFHALAAMAADALVGPGRPDDPEWCYAYRGLDHKRARDQLTGAGDRAELDAPAVNDLRRLAREFNLLWELRQAADYDPAPFGLSQEDTALLVNTAFVASERVARLAPAVRTSLALRLLVPTPPARTSGTPADTRKGRR